MRKHDKREAVVQAFEVPHVSLAKKERYGQAQRWHSKDFHLDSTLGRKTKKNPRIAWAVVLYRPESKRWVGTQLYGKRVFFCSE